MEKHLSEDLIAEILCRVPIKILFGFKCVSKAWNCLISNVCILRIIREPTPPSGFLFHAARFHNADESFADYISCLDDGDNVTAVIGDGFVKSYSSLLPSKYSPYYVHDCCNGLILLGSCSVPRYFVCNPATKQCVAIPKLRAQVELYFSALAFDPCESLHYKVVRFVYGLCCSASNPPALDIFSSETGKWIRRKVPIEPSVAYGVPLVMHSVYLDGLLYRLCVSKNLLCFDLKALTAQAIEVPYKEKIDLYGFIGVSKGVLYYANHDRYRILIWQFDYHKKAGYFWTLKHSICIPDLKTKHPDGRNLCAYSHSSLLMPYAIYPTSDVIVLGIPQMLFTYHLKSNKLELLCKRPVDREIVLGQLAFYPYMSCFVRLKEFTRHLHTSSNW